MAKINPKGMSGAERLRKLADLIETIPEENLDQKIWGRANRRGQLVCGSPACSLGWATILFRGLHMEPVNEVGEESYPVFRDDECQYAGERFFKLNYSQADTCFGAHDRTPAQQAEVLRDMADSLERATK